MAAKTLRAFAGGCLALLSAPAGRLVVVLWPRAGLRLPLRYADAAGERASRRVRRGARAAGPAAAQHRIPGAPARRVARGGGETPGPLAGEWRTCVAGNARLPPDQPFGPDARAPLSSCGRWWPLERARAATAAGETLAAHARDARSRSRASPRGGRRAGPKIRRVGAPARASAAHGGRRPCSPRWWRRRDVGIVAPHLTPVSTPRLLRVHVPCTAFPFSLVAPPRSTASHPAQAAPQADSGLAGTDHGRVGRNGGVVLS